jgi:gluconate 2-dehydrogenase gamma chain
MEEQVRLSRRRFVQLTGMAVGSICLLSQCEGSASSWRFFTLDEARLMDALAEQIIPPDEWMGGREAGVTNFIDKQVTGVYSRYLRTYRTGLASIQSTCLSRYNKKFEEIPWDEQTSFLEEMEAGTMKETVWAAGFDREFFNLLRDHSMQAYYGSPRHGGNKDFVSFRMMKLDYPRIFGQNRYKR